MREKLVVSVKNKREYQEYLHSELSNYISFYEFKNMKNNGMIKDVKEVQTMRIPENMYPSDFDGLLGEVKCFICGRKLDLDEEAIQDEYDHQFYCELCYPDVVEEREEEE